LQIKTKIVSCHTADSKPVKQEVNGTVILPPLVFPVGCLRSTLCLTASWVRALAPDQLREQLQAGRLPSERLLETNRKWMKRRAGFSTRNYRRCLAGKQLLPQAIATALTTDTAS